MRLGVVFFIVSVLLSACSEKEASSKHPYRDYFYPWDGEPKIYAYRDVIGGLEEQFHRVYKVTDPKGIHMIVERYASDGRILEAFNFNMDSLDLQDHMVVNNQQKKTQAALYKTTYFPWNKNQTSHFASKFEGVEDSTLILEEINRTLSNENAFSDVMEKKTRAIKYLDNMRVTILNPFIKKEKVYKTAQMSFYAEGFGLVEWKSLDGKTHFKLEQILSQKEWIQMLSR